MTTDIQSSSLALSTPRKVLIFGTLLLAGRAMTLAFIGRVGNGGPGDPPNAWLMPLWGDAVVGITAVVVAFLLWRRPSRSTWLVFVVWSSIGIWDAMSAYLIHVAEPWPDFFMIKAFGSSMFFMAAAFHLALMWIAFRPTVRTEFAAG